MPFVHIDLFEGRTDEQKIALAHDITEAVIKTQVLQNLPFMFLLTI
jgi:phenylpyruvate tautomerase PptA (4-oxalocrotonate tautomerase family)